VELVRLCAQKRVKQEQHIEQCRRTAQHLFSNEIAPALARIVAQREAAQLVAIEQRRRIEFSQAPTNISCARALNRKKICQAIVNCKLAGLANMTRGVLRSQVPVPLQDPRMPDTKSQSSSELRERRDSLNKLEQFELPRRVSIEDLGRAY
jgi:hypothetical protein